MFRILVEGGEYRLNPGAVAYHLRRVVSRNDGLAAYVRLGISVDQAMRRIVHDLLDLDVELLPDDLHQIGTSEYWTCNKHFLTVTRTYLKCGEYKFVPDMEATDGISH